MSEAERAVFEVEFLQKLQRLLESGSFSATYKFALLIALTNLAVRRGADDDSPLRLSFDEIAREFVALYWTHVRPYREGAVLRQNTGRQARILKLIEQTLENEQRSMGTRKPDPNAVESGLVRRAVVLIAEMPVWKLQTVERRPRGEPEHDDCFLYPNVGSGNTIELRCGVGACLRRFRGLVVALVQARWVEWIRTQNRPILGHSSDLERFLFGQEREALSKYVGVLGDLQCGRCFYTGNALGAQEMRQVDHFIPWACYETNSPPNLVLASAQSNSAKRDHLASVRHLRSWVDRNETHAAVLRDRLGASSADWENTRSIARWAYGRAARMQNLVWDHGSQLVQLDPSWSAVLG